MRFPRKHKAVIFKLEFKDGECCGGEYDEATVEVDSLDHAKISVWIASCYGDSCSVSLSTSEAKALARAIQAALSDQADILRRTEKAA